MVRAASAGTRRSLVHPSLALRAGLEYEAQMAHQAPAAQDSNGRDPRVLAIDAGGTMTDTFIVDGAGSFVVGKAQTTPEDESIGFMESARDALEQWDSSPEESFPRIASGIYSGTAMLNRLLSRTGRNIGAIVTAGNEDYLRIERGI